VVIISEITSYPKLSHTTNEKLQRLNCKQLTLPDLNHASITDNINNHELVNKQSKTRCNEITNSRNFTFKCGVTQKFCNGKPTLPEVSIFFKKYSSLLIYCHALTFNISKYAT
jgi:hypothetical protein